MLVIRSKHRSSYYLEPSTNPNVKSAVEKATFGWKSILYVASAALCVLTSRMVRRLSFESNSMIREGYLHFFTWNNDAKVELCVRLQIFLRPIVIDFRLKQEQITKKLILQKYLIGATISSDIGTFSFCRLPEAAQLCQRDSPCKSAFSWTSNDRQKMPFLELRVRVGRASSITDDSFDRWNLYWQKNSCIATVNGEHALCSAWLKVLQFSTPLTIARLYYYYSTYYANKRQLATQLESDRHSAASEGQFMPNGCNDNYRRKRIHQRLGPLPDRVDGLESHTALTFENTSSFKLDAPLFALINASL